MLNRMHHNNLCIYFLLWLFIPIMDCYAQCREGRYVEPVFTASRVLENHIYETAPTLQGACLIETNTAMVDYGLDVYMPDGDSLDKRPCMVYAHGGAFLIGNPQIVPIPDFCYKMASRGFVMISIDYRHCFNTASTASAERAVYRAVQDMCAAVRWAKHHASFLRIDTNLIFVGGNSAGGIMSIFTAYGQERERSVVTSTYAAPDLGCLNCSGNNYRYSKRVAGVMSLWGATLDVNIIEPGDPPIICFHGDQDNAVFHDYGNPFSFPLFPPLYGSTPIIAYCDSIGIENEYHIFQGYGHEPWLVNPSNVDTIVKYASRFFHRLFLQPPVPVVTAPGHACVNDTVVITAHPAASTRYCWQLPGAAWYVQNGDGSIVKAIWDSSGVFQIRATAINRYDASSDPAVISITIHPKPQIQVGRDTVICQGMKTTLMATGGTDYHWTPDSSLSHPDSAVTLANPSVTTSYQVTVSDAFCSSRGSVTVEVLPAPRITTDHHYIRCLNDTIRIHASATGVPRWIPATGLSNPAGFSTSCFVDSSTQYILQVTGLNGCQSFDTVFVEVVPPPPSPQIHLSGNVLSTDGGYTYQWFLDGAMIFGATSRTYVPHNSGTYRVMITDSNGCKAISPPFYLQLSHIQQPGFESTGLSVTPNPAGGFINISLSPEAKSGKLYIYNLTGQPLVYIPELEIAPEGLLPLNITHLPAGCYWICIETGEQIWYEKVIIY